VLHAIDQSPSRLVKISKVSKHLGHYVFPDPRLLITPATNEKKAKFLEAWLQACEALLMRVTNKVSVAMSGQNWHDFLATMILTQKDTKVAKCRQQILDMLTPKYDLFPNVKTQSTTGEPITWQGRKYISSVLPADNIVREILWELYELNFYYELLSLDCRTCTNLVTSDSLQLIHRHALISKCFPINPFKSTFLMARNYRLAGQDVKEHLPFVLSLVQVMQSCKGDRPPVFQLAAQSFYEISASHATELEDAVTKYYCTTISDVQL
jgi:hypothetical protein